MANLEEEEKYGASSIQVLEGLEPVRKRPGMYIGSTSSRGLHHLVWEIVDNSIDEALAGFCNHVEVEVLPGDIISVTDNGRGMPVDLHPKTKRPAVETILQYCMLVVNLMESHIKYQEVFMVLVLRLLMPYQNG